jgi:ribosomal protein S18 acetylase RimI-like enzyme
MEPIFLKLFNRLATDELINFAVTNPLRPYHGTDQLKRFLTNLTSDDKLVFDVHGESGRVACAILLDKISNPGNSACLEIIGLDRSCTEIEEIYDLLLCTAKVALRQSFGGIEIGIYDDCPLPQNFFEQRGFSFFYATFDMIRIENEQLSQDLPTGYTWQVLTKDNLHHYYHVLKTAFANNLETAVSDFDALTAAFENRKFPCFLLTYVKEIIGFLTFAIDAEENQNGEVSTIGLKPQYRGSGLGKLLLAKAVNELTIRGVNRIKLTVAAENEAALGLYRRSGFVITSRDLCLRFSRPID